MMDSKTNLGDIYTKGFNNELISKRIVRFIEFIEKILSNEDVTDMAVFLANLRSRSELRKGVSDDKIKIKFASTGSGTINKEIRDAFTDYRLHETMEMDPKGRFYYIEAMDFVLKDLAVKHNLRNIYYDMEVRYIKADDGMIIEEDIKDHFIIIEFNMGQDPKQ